MKNDHRQAPVHGTDRRYAELMLDNRVHCYMPNTRCDGTSTNLREFNGGWLPVCDKHKEDL